MASKMPTRKDVALLAGVSVATVSNVFLDNGLVSKETEAKVREAAAQLKYVPNFTARNLVMGRSNHIGIAINESTNPYHMEIVKHIEDYALSKGFLVTVFDMTDSLKNKARFIEHCNLDALVNFTTVEFYDDFLEILQSQNTVMVNFGRDKGPSFGQNERAAVIDSMEKLAGLGHRNVGYVSTLGRNQMLMDRRFSVFYENRNLYGFSEDDDLIECERKPSLKSSERGYLGTMSLMKRHPEITALFVMNDIAAIGAIRALKDMGLTCPEDVSVIGCDDIELARLQVPSLSTFGFDKKEFGTRMAEKMVEFITGKESGIGYEFQIDSQAIFRESVSVCRTK